jgi:hypothetical protein
MMPAYNAPTWAPCDEALVVDTAAADFPIPRGSRGLYVGVTGDITVIMARTPATGVLFKAVPAGVILPIIVSSVVKAGTTATNLVAIF